jgi:hypothetical protein
MAARSLPHSHMHQRSLAVFAGRNRPNIGHRYRSGREGPGKRGIRSNRYRRRAVAGRNEHQPVAQEGLTRARDDQTALFDCIHPCFVRGNEQIGGRPGLDLPRQRRRTCKRNDRPGMTHRGPGLGGGGHRFLQARCSENQRRGARRRQRAAACRHHQQQGQQKQESAHDRSRLIRPGADNKRHCRHWVDAALATRDGARSE